MNMQNLAPAAEKDGVTGKRKWFQRRKPEPLPLVEVRLDQDKVRQVLWKEIRRRAKVQIEEERLHDGIGYREVDFDDLPNMVIQSRFEDITRVTGTMATAELLAKMLRWTRGQTLETYARAFATEVVFPFHDREFREYCLTILLDALDPLRWNLSDTLYLLSDVLLFRDYGFVATNPGLMYTPVSNALREIGVPQEIIIQVSNAYEGYTTRDRALQKLYAPVSLFRPWKDAKRIPSRQDVYKAMVSYYRDEILRQIDAITSEELRTLTHYQSEA
jgi:hypothetical protein